MEFTFFLPMVPPTVTHQEKKVRVVVRDGRHVPQFYEPYELQAARAMFREKLAQHAPERKLKGPVVLQVSWRFPLDKGKRHRDGEYKTSKPDTDNLQKLLKDCMTTAGFWRDDAQVCLECVEKLWAERPGILIRVEEMAPETPNEEGGAERLL